MNKEISLYNVWEYGKAQKTLKKNNKKWPWLKHISDDGLAWTVVDSVGRKVNEEIINFDIYLSDGSKLSDKKNKGFLAVALSYGEVFRLYHPSSSAELHLSRVNSLLTFIIWLSKYKIKSLKNVKKEHVYRYIKQISYGKEIALGVPNNVFDTIKSMLNKEVNIPILPGYINKVDRAALYKKSSSLAYNPHNFQISGKICDWFDGVIKQKLFSIDLSNTTYLDVLEEQGALPSLSTVQDIHRKLIPLEEMWLWSKQIGTVNFSHNPFPEGSSKEATRNGVATKRTKTIPPKLAFSLISESAKWIVDYSETILSICNTDITVEDATKSLSDVGLNLTVSDISQFISIKHEKVNKAGLAKMLMSACFIVIASLSARRKEEIMDLGYNCIEDGVDCYWLKIYIEKTLQEYELSPAPEIVNCAIKVLESLSKSARTTTCQDSLWIFENNDKIIKLSPARDINKFYKLICKELSDEYDWKFSPHQFRRFFALIYYHRYQDASISVLSYHLRHFDLEMTRRYVVDDDFMKAMNEVADEWTAEFLRGVIKGDNHIGGKGGKKIVDKLNDWKVYFSKKVDVVASEFAVEKMMRYMKRIGSEFTQHIWGTICSCPKNTGLSKYAKCANEEGVPQLSNGSVTLCGKCPFTIHTKKYKSSLENEVSNIEANKLFSDDDDILKELSNVKIIQMEDMINNAESLNDMRENK